uniref:G-protein coupled receptors family 1 profile domain-containing protein n=1 Tax=Lepeophtheirus salmonis TaxID=72036 RepID=A0A0K2TZ94_LEPSM
MATGSARGNTISRGIPGAGIFISSEERNNETSNGTAIECPDNSHSAAVIIFVVSGLGITANIVIMFLILTRKSLRRWSQGLLFHQALVDCARAAILVPLGISILKCQPVNKCSLVETAFLLLVTVSSVNLLTTVLNDAPVLPDDDDDDALPMLMDSPQCVIFGMFMIWFASITINLGPTFLSGALAANSESYLNRPSCPLIQGPFRHYVLNVLWIFINVLCVLLTMYHLYKLYKDLTKSNLEAVRVTSLVTALINVNAGVDSESYRIKSYIQKMEKEGIARVKMFIIITVAYLIFWGPLFLVTLFSYGDYKTEDPSASHEITLHVAFVHAFVNPTLFLVLHKGLRKATLDLICCNFHDSESPQTEEYPPDQIAITRGSNGTALNMESTKIHNSLNHRMPLSTDDILGSSTSTTNLDGPISSLSRAYILPENRSETGTKRETTL